MSYTIDIYNRELEPTDKFLDFALFVSFFPQLVAGPIERAKHLLPQILFPRKIKLKDFYEGAYLIFWGLFLKVVIADNLAKIVDPVFSSSGPYNGFNVLLSLYAFAFQIFGDFAGYSNIARGLGKCMGFDIMVNFNLPYFSVNPSDFWKRWHISLSTWLRDYLYIPLGGNRTGTLNTYRNLLITMILGGLWHGAAWTFVLWGFYQGVLLISHRLLLPFLSSFAKKAAFFSSRTWNVICIIIFFHFVCFGWLIFRANNIQQILSMCHSLLFNFKVDIGSGLENTIMSLALFSGTLLLIQLLQGFKKDLLAVYRLSAIPRIFIYVFLFFLALIFGVTNGEEFIYFQF